MSLRSRRRERATLALEAAVRPGKPRQAAPIKPPAGPGLSSPWADPDALQVVTWAGLLDGLDPDVLAGLPVTRAQALAVPVIRRGRNLIVGSCARLDLFAASTAGRVATQPRSIAQPEVGRPRMLTIAWTVDALIFDGYAVWEVAQRYAEDGRPQTFRFVPNSAVQFDDAGNVSHVHGRPVGPFDVVRFDALDGGLLTEAAETIRAARALHATVNRAARNPTPDVELHQDSGEDLTDGEIDKLIAKWVAARRGANGGVAYTNRYIKAIMHGAQPQDLLIAARKAADLDLARHLNLPAWAVDAEVGGTNMTYSNVPARARELIDYSLAPYIEAITARLSLDDVLAAGTWCGWSADVLTNGDFGDRMKAYADALAIYSRDELRAREAGQPIEGPQA